MGNRTAEIPYESSHCHKAFTGKDALDIHRRPHTGGKPYKCSHCNNAFLKKRNLEIHMRIHTDEISFTDLSNINYYFKFMKHIYKVQRNTFTYESIILSMDESTMYGYII